MPFTADDLHFMKEALAFARIAFSEQEVPIGAVVVSGGKMTGRGRNRREFLADPTHHAEIEAIREAAREAGTWHLEGATLYATVEPCVMCAGAALHARVGRLVYAAPDPRAGAIESVYRLLADERWNHRVRTHGGVLADDSRALLREFFGSRR